MKDSMSGRFCYICGKGAMAARFVSHANNKSKRKMQVNLRLLKIMEDGRSRTVRLCVKCYRKEREKLKKSQLAQKTEQLISASQSAQKQKTY